jgi:hypothetical protein
LMTKGQQLGEGMAPGLGGGGGGRWLAVLSFHTCAARRRREGGGGVIDRVSAICNTALKATGLRELHS